MTRLITQKCQIVLKVFLLIKKKYITLYIYIKINRKPYDYKNTHSGPGVVALKCLNMKKEPKNTKKDSEMKIKWCCASRWLNFASESKPQCPGKIHLDYHPIHLILIHHHYHHHYHHCHPCWRHPFHFQDLHRWSVEEKYSLSHHHPCPQIRKKWAGRKRFSFWLLVCPCP